MRVLAPLALVVFGLAFLLVIATSGGSGDEAKPDANQAEKTRDLGGPASEKSTKKSDKSSEKDLGDDVYVVKKGDTLGGIAESTGVPVERLQELNPGLDQFSLVAGQRIKLR